MLPPGFRERRVIRVLGEDLLGRNILLELHEKAVPAHPGCKRIVRFHGVEFALCEKVVGERRHSKINELDERAAAETAAHIVTRQCASHQAHHHMRSDGPSRSSTTGTERHFPDKRLSRSLMIARTTTSVKRDMPLALRPSGPAGVTASVLFVSVGACRRGAVL